MVKSLTEDLKFWRAERPDEWTMDEFIRKSTKLESTNKQLLEALEAAKQFITNVIELGYIRMPDQDTPDSAHKTLPLIDAVIAAAKGE